jgi:hypothetical protein
MVAEKRMRFPAGLKGEVLTDDFSPADVLAASGRRYRREK